MQRDLWLRTGDRGRGLLRGLGAGSLRPGSGDRQGKVEDGHAGQGRSPTCSPAQRHVRLADPGRRQDRLRRRRVRTVVAPRTRRTRAALVAVSSWPSSRETGKIAWKYDVGPKPEPLDPPITIKDAWGEHVFHFGPATSTVWSTPSFDAATRHHLLRHRHQQRARQPTTDDPRLRHEVMPAPSSPSMPPPAREVGDADQPRRHLATRACGPTTRRTGRYQDQSIGDTPKVYTIDVDGKPTKVVGCRLQERRLLRPQAADGKMVGPHPGLHRQADLSPRPRAGQPHAWPARHHSAACRPAVPPTARASSPTASTG